MFLRIEPAFLIALERQRGRGLGPRLAHKQLEVERTTGAIDHAHVAQRAQLTALFEPAMIIFMGVLVGFVAIALVSAMYGIFGQVNIK